MAACGTEEGGGFDEEVEEEPDPDDIRVYGALNSKKR